MSSRDAKAREPRVSVTPPSVRTASIAPQHGQHGCVCQLRPVAPEYQNQAATNNARTYLWYSIPSTLSLGLHHRRSWPRRFRRSRCTPTSWSTPCPPHKKTQEMGQIRQKSVESRIASRAGCGMSADNPPLSDPLSLRIAPPVLTTRRSGATGCCVRRCRAHVDLHTNKNKTTSTIHVGSSCNIKKGGMDHSVHNTRERTGRFSWSACKAMDDGPGNSHRNAAKNVDRYVRWKATTAATTRLTHMKW